MKWDSGLRRRECKENVMLIPCSAMDRRIADSMMAAQRLTDLGARDDMIFGGGDFAMAFNSWADSDRFAIDGTPLLQCDSAGRFVLPSSLEGSTGVDEIGDELASILLRQHFQKSRRWRDIEPAYRDAVIERRREG